MIVNDVGLHSWCGRPSSEVSHITRDRIRGTVWISWCVFAVCARGGGGERGRGGGAWAEAANKQPPAPTANKKRHQRRRNPNTSRRTNSKLKNTHTHRHLPTGPTAKKTHTPPRTNSKEQHYPRRQQKKTNNTLPYEGVCCLGLNWPFTELLVCRGFSCRAQQQTKTTPFRLVCADRVTCRSPKPMLTARACVW